MGRAPCCDKANVKRGPWSPEEDSILKAYIELHGTGGNWIALPQNIGLKRCGKSCRLRWLNYLRPNIKHGGFSEDEDNIICALYLSIGSRWSIIAAQLPGRTDNDIKNYWNTRLKKKLIGKQRKEQQVRRASFYKQEMKVESYANNNAFNVQNEAMVNQTPYWPAISNSIGMPTTTYRHEPSLEDQESIKNLLIKLGGIFSESDHQYYSHQPNTNMNTTSFSYPNNNNTSWIQESELYESSINSMVANSSTSTTSTTNSIIENYSQQQLENNYNNLSGSCSPNMFNVGLSELDELLYHCNPNASNESESFGIEMLNNGTNNPLLLNYQNFQESGLLQYPILKEPRYYVGSQ